MESNKNIFYATNPARLKDALWKLISESKLSLPDMLIFLPNRRSVRSVEKMLVEKNGGALILPHLVALGEEPDDNPEEPAESPDVISNMERIVVLAKLLSADASIGGIATALPLAHDLIRMTSYLENEGIDPSKIDWEKLVDEKYAAHFTHKATLMNILSKNLPAYYKGRITETQKRNNDIHDWIKLLNNYELVVVCGSTASVPATADLMEEVFKLKQGRIILPGKIAGNAEDFGLDTNPYNSEYKFLKRIGIGVKDIVPIDVGDSYIDFFNLAFSNGADSGAVSKDISCCHLVQCDHENDEAIIAAEITKKATESGKSVLIITPDLAGNQRLAMELAKRKIKAHFSGGTKGSMTVFGRAILNLFNDWLEKESDTFEKFYEKAGFDLFDTIVSLIEEKSVSFEPEFDIESPNSLLVLDEIKKLSDCLNSAGIRLSLSDACAFLADSISCLSIRNTQNESALVSILGTIESRMQTADSVIFTGLNDGMFPSRGYKNAWLPRNLAEEIGLPSQNRKVSLMSLDFMTLSCGKEVYWLRSKESGDLQAIESRFISRVRVRNGNFDTKFGDNILANLKEKNNIPSSPLDYSAPQPPRDWSDIYVTELELLIHNPYAFYARHILRLRPLDDYWKLPGAREFGILVHDVIKSSRDFSADKLIKKMDEKAKKLLGEKSIIFHFWHKRFMEIAPAIEMEMKKIPDSLAETEGEIKIEKRIIKARADRVWSGGVMDIKTGKVPNKKQLTEGNMPQLPLEAYILKKGGFPLPVTEKSLNPEMIFLQLKNNDVCTVVYNRTTTKEMINAAVDKTKEMIDIYSAGGASYEYRETGDKKYQEYDDLARKDD